MRRSLQVFVVMIISGCCLSLNSCLEVTCIDETEAYVKVNFYSYSTGKQTLPDSLTLYGIDMEDLLIYKNVKITPPALIPLRDSTILSEFIFRINGISDTVGFYYWNYPHLVTKECGYSMFHNVYSSYHTRHTIDSISIINENITTANVENISIYY